MIVTKRIYESYDPSDGFRVLIDRLWPRGVSKAKGHVDLWAKEIAPSRELREWYRHDREKWPEFRRRYLRELKSPEATAVVDELVRRGKRGRVTLLYASQTADICNAAVLEPMLNRRARA